MQSVFVFVTVFAVSFIADDFASENAAKSLFVAYSAIDENSINLLRQVATVKTNASVFCQTDDGDFATQSVYMLFYIHC